MRITRRCCACLLLLALFAFGQPTGLRAAAAPAACSPPPLDLVLVLDDSGSMVEAPELSDPQALRITAADLLIDLLGPEDRAGVVLFNQDVRQAPLAALPAGAPGLHKLIDSYNSKGGTRLDWGVAAGLKMLKPDPTRIQAILLLTDGEPDSEPEKQVANLTALAAQARDSGVRLIAVGLGAVYDRNLLDNLTRIANSPLTVNVQQPGDLVDAFFKILWNLKGLAVAEVPPSGLTPRDRDQQPRQVALQRANTGKTPWGYTVPPVAGPVSMRGDYSWLVSRPPFAIDVLAPAQRQPVAPGTAVAVHARVTSCDGGPAPSNGVVAAVLDANGNATGEGAWLSCDSGGDCSGSVTVRSGGPASLDIMVGDGGRQAGRKEVALAAGGGGPGVGGSGGGPAPDGSGTLPAFGGESAAALQADLRAGRFPQVPSGKGPAVGAGQSEETVPQPQVARQGELGGLAILRRHPWVALSLVLLLIAALLVPRLTRRRLPTGPTIVVRSGSGRALVQAFGRESELVLNGSASLWWPAGASLKVSISQTPDGLVARVTNLNPAVPLTMEGVAWPEIFVGPVPISAQLGEQPITLQCQDGQTSG